MGTFFIVSVALFVVNAGALGILLCRLSATESRTTNAMDQENFSGIDFNAMGFSGVDPLETFKTTQLNLVYYSILPFGALYGLSLLRLFDIPWYRIILIVAALIMFDFGIYMVVELQYKLQQTRVSRLRYKKRYRLNHYWMSNAEVKSQSAKDKRFWRDARISIMLIAVQAFALLSFLYSLLEDQILNRNLIEQCNWFL